MTDDKLFSLVAGLAILIWLLGRGPLRGRIGRKAELAAFALVGVGIVYALVQTLLWYARGG